MAKAIRSARICPKGHRYYKSSDCPVCPVCEQQKKPADGFLAAFSAPARRALQQHGIDKAEKLSGYTEAEILSWHGIGPSSLPKIKQALKQVRSGLRK